MNIGLIAEPKDKSPTDDAFKASGNVVYYAEPSLAGERPFDRCEAVWIRIDIGVISDPKMPLFYARQDLGPLKSILKAHRHLSQIPFYLDCKTLPKTCDSLAKFYKLRLYAVNSVRHHVGCEDDPASIDAQEKMLSRMFGNQNIYTCEPNRLIELQKYIESGMDSCKEHLYSVFNAYCKKIGAAPMMPISTKPGFGGRNLDDMRVFISELKRIGMHVGFFEQMMFENAIYRSGNDMKPPRIEWPDGIEK